MSRTFVVTIGGIFLMLLYSDAATQWPQSQGEDGAATVRHFASGGCAVSGNKLSAKLNISYKDAAMSSKDPESKLGMGLTIGWADMSLDFGVDPDFGLYDDKPPNAMATPTSVVARNASKDGSVLMGRNLIADEQRHDRRYWGAAATLIFAHEFAHIYQFKRKLELSNPAFELHADYLAGWYMGNANRRTRGRYANMDAAAESLFRKGDYDFNSKDSHGTPEQRLAAMRRGYDSGLANDSLERSYQSGLRTVGELLR